MSARATPASNPITTTRRPATYRKKSQLVQKTMMVLMVPATDTVSALV
jgi:hypothetical protein